MAKRWADKARLKVLLAYLPFCLTLLSQLYIAWEIIWINYLYWGSPLETVVFWGSCFFVFALHIVPSFNFYLLLGLTKNAVIKNVNKTYTIQRQPDNNFEAFHLYQQPSPTFEYVEKNDINKNGYDVWYRWHPLAARQCFQCNKEGIVKPPNTVHCRSCHTCHYRVDHHCEFLNTCIDETNYPAFINFVFMAAFGLGLQKWLEFHLFASWIEFAPYTVWFKINLLPLDWLTTSYSNCNIETVNLVGGFVLFVDYCMGLTIFVFLLALLRTHFDNLINNTTSITQFQTQKLVSKYYLNDDARLQSILEILPRAKADGFVLTSVEEQLLDQTLPPYPTNINWYDLRGYAEKKQVAVWLNIWYRVVSDSRHFSVSSSTRRAYETDAIIHALACYLVPGWWRLSGERARHGDISITKKYHTWMAINADKRLDNFGHRLTLAMAYERLELWMKQEE